MVHVLWDNESSADAPILVMALEGLFDISGAATDAVNHLAEKATARVKIASIDPEVFFDFTQQRPTVALDSTGLRSLTWPENDAYELTLDGDVSSLLTISGIEPHLRWRTFAEAVGEIAQKSGARLVVTLGAMAGQAPHTRALGVVGSATDPVLAERLGLGRPSYEGPTGLVGALHVHLHELGLAVISLRVSVPHYVTQSPNPRGDSVATGPARIGYRHPDRPREFRHLRCRVASKGRRRGRERRRDTQLCSAPRDPHRQLGRPAPIRR